MSRITNDTRLDRQKSDWKEKIMCKRIKYNKFKNSSYGKIPFQNGKIFQLKVANRSPSQKRRPSVCAPPSLRSKFKSFRPIFKSTPIQMARTWRGSPRSLACPRGSLKFGSRTAGPGRRSTSILERGDQAAAEVNLQFSWVYFSEIWILYLI